MSRIRRTRLYVPGNSPDLQINCGLYGADCVILDLEDSVAPSEKDAARLLVKNALLTLDFGKSEKIVRINCLKTPYGQKDLEAIVPSLPDVIVVPKCECSEDIIKIDKAIARIEENYNLKKRIELMPLIESAKGTINAYEICTASKRNVAVNFGAEDFTADLGVERTREGKEHFWARCQIVLAAKAAGLQALDTSYSNIEDIEGLIASTLESKQLGFEGRGVIHPSQIKPIHEVFKPSPAEVEFAKKVVSAMAEAEKNGSGVIALGNKMIDKPVILRAKRILSLTEQM